LQVDCNVVALPAQAANSGSQRDAAGGIAPIVDGQAPIDDRHEVEQLAVFCADEPVDARRRDCTPNGRSHWNRMHDVPEGAKADDQIMGHVVTRR
jgi:hypothetical protein